MIFEAYEGRAALVAALSGQIADELRAAIAARGRAVLSVPGGTTPAPVFEALAETDLDWSKVYVLLNDERWVDETSPRSNTALLKRSLLTGRAAQAHLLPLYAPMPAPEEALDELSAALSPYLPIDVLLLGMGADMHTASLFPAADLLAEALSEEAPVLMALRAEAAGEPRITLSARVLKAARATHILITGDEKRAALARAQTLPPMLAPVACVLPAATVHWAE